ncbi:alanine racemase [Helicobacter mesocricetorum]|uniref:alanine racemase n=1 Tax=Helicobacter mesocricetorum TaxID=87012 RepID=UPI000CF0FA2A|nr:alanine racemase [Helicobacter mesocricetorum]
MPYIKIHSQNFFDNFHTLCQVISPNNPQRLAIVLKDNAYGHGLKEMASLAKECGIISCFVKNIQESLQIVEFFPHISILYPNPLEHSPLFRQCLESPNIYFCISSLEKLQDYPPFSRIELKINTGMNRNGIAYNHLKEAFEVIIKNKLQLIGVFTHNGFGDNFGCEFYAQNATFLEVKKEVLKLCEKHSLPKPRFHSLCSSAGLRANTDCNIPQSLQDDCYRIGIAFYGYLCQEEILSIPLSLKPVASLWAKKISSRNLKKGERVGYGGASTLSRDCVVSTYDIGYGDGLFRLREGMELYTKEGFKILPPASMDCISVESEEEEICVFDDVKKWAEAFHTIPYEILTHLHPYIPKKII